MATLSSYNKFHKNIIFDVFLVSIANCLTSFIAGFAIFGTLGYLAKILDSNVEEVVESGIELAFVTYPDLVSAASPQLCSCPPCPCRSCGASSSSSCSSPWASTPPCA